MCLVCIQIGTYVLASAHKHVSMGHSVNAMGELEVKYFCCAK